MRIATSTLYDRSTTQMAALTAKSDTLSTQISTGSKIQVASDDPLGYSQLASLKQQNADGTAWSSNISLAQTLVTQSDTTLSQIQAQMQRAQELAVQANTGTLNDTDKAAITTELKSILTDVASLANTKDVRGQPLFGGATGDSAVTTNADGTVSITATGTPASIPIGDDATIQPTDSAAKVFGGVAGTNGTTDVFSTLTNLINAIQSGGDIGTASADLTTAANQVTNARTSLGARGNRLDLEATQNKAAADDREVRRGQVEDTDVTSAVTELQKTMTILSATQASFTKLSSLSLFTYLT